MLFSVHKFSIIMGWHDVISFKSLETVAMQGCFFIICFQSSIQLASNLENLRSTHTKQKQKQKLSKENQKHQTISGKTSKNIFAFTFAFAWCGGTIRDEWIDMSLLLSKSVGTPLELFSNCKCKMAKYTLNYSLLLPHWLQKWNREIEGTLLVMS